MADRTDELSCAIPQKVVGLAICDANDKDTEFPLIEPLWRVPKVYAAEFRASVPW
jgi:hypothetical protein